MNNSSNIVWHQPIVTRARRETQNQHKSAIIWFTGLSGAGKSTIAHALEKALFDRNCRTVVLDGDNVRHGLCGDLGFSEADRVENIRRVGEVAKLFIEAGMLTLTAFISPFRADRAKVRAMVGPGEFIEVFCNTPLKSANNVMLKDYTKKHVLVNLSSLLAFPLHMSHHLPPKSLSTQILKLFLSVQIKSFAN